MAESFDRAENLARMGSEEFDVLVVGGGITGAGVALDAASRGLRTALVEARDLASGTSSKSSKLVHGGLRYLRTGDVRLVTEALAERQILLRNAAHLVRPLPFLIPLPSDGRSADRVALSLGLWIYDLAGGLRIGHRHRRLSATDVQEAVTGLRPGSVSGGYVYYDAHADDVRLTLAVLRTAALNHGAAVANYSPVTSLTHDNSGRVAGATVTAEGVGRVDIRARAVVNATGVWVDDVSGLDGRPAPASVRPAKGIHITIPRAPVGNTPAVVLAAADGRSVFVIGWGDDPSRAYVGTTDTDYSGPLDDVRVAEPDVRYLLDAVNRHVSEPIGIEDVTASWAGLRPLVRDRKRARTADLSRRHRIDTSPSGLVSVTGGKLTTYRRMARDTMSVVAELLSLPPTQRRSRTRRLALRGAAGAGGEAGRYGSEAPAFESLRGTEAGWAEPLVEGAVYEKADVVWSATHEMAVHVSDVLERRTRLRLLTDPGPAIRTTAELMGGALGWDAAQVDREVAAYRSLLRDSES